MSTSQESAPQNASGPPKPSQIPPMSIQQEDSIIHTRITNDEKALRRVTKKFHTYTTMAHDPVVPPAATGAVTIDDARDAFLVELASFHLSLKKSLMVCEAEARQVEEYQRERERIEKERELLKEQIEGLKVSLEQAQIQRRRKMEYDVIAEKVNALPSREELEQSILSIENDMIAIRTEHDDQTRVLQAQQSALEVVISSIQDLRMMGKQDLDVAETSRAPSPSGDGQPGEVEEDVDMDSRTREETGEIQEEKEEGEEAEDPKDSDTPRSKSLNPSARPFIPHSSSSRLSTPLHQSTSQQGDSSVKHEVDELEDDDDIEMGELAEDPQDKQKARDEELEEGEASDMSSELSDPPDD